MDNILHLIKVNSDEHILKMIQVERLRQNVLVWVKKAVENFCQENQLPYTVAITTLYRFPSNIVITIHECELHDGKFDKLKADLKEALSTGFFDIEFRFTKLSENDTVHPYDDND